MGRQFGSATLTCRLQSLKLQSLLPETKIAVPLFEWAMSMDSTTSLWPCRVN